MKWSGGMWFSGVLAMFVALCLAGFAGGPVAGSQGTPGATPEGATPRAENVLGETTPEALYAALLVSQVPADILPPGPEPADIYPWQDTNDDDLVGTLGGAVIVTTDDPFGSEFGTEISYIVFPDESGAAERFGSISSISGDDGTRIEPVDSLGFPAMIVAFPDQALCIVQVGYVLVISAVVPTGDAAGDDAAAIDVVEAGVAHLVSVAGMPGAVWGAPGADGPG